MQLPRAHGRLINSCALLRNGVCPGKDSNCQLRKRKKKKKKKKKKEKEKRRGILKKICWFSKRAKLNARQTAWKEGLSVVSEGLRNHDDCRSSVSWPARRLLPVIRYFEWQGRFFYRRSHLNAKYYSNGTGFLSHPFALSQRLLFSCPLLLFLVLSALFPAHPLSHPFSSLSLSPFCHTSLSTSFSLRFRSYDSISLA